MMTEWDRQPEDTSQTAIPQRLRDDLTALYRAQVAVPAEVDRQVAAMARQRMVGRRRQRLLLRMAGVGVAAAASIGVVFWLVSPPRTQRPVDVTVAAAALWPEDIDGSGRVDILDAFAVARHVERGAAFRQEYDIDSDGRLTRIDVDKIAMVAVRLDREAVQ